MCRIAARAASSNDLLGGQIMIASDNLPSMLPHVQSGKVRAIAVRDNKRLSVLPQVPTYAEEGYAEVSEPLWLASLRLPAPRDIVMRLNAAVHQVVATPAFRAKLESLSASSAAGTPEQFAAQAKTLLERYRRVAKRKQYPHRLRHSVHPFQPITIERPQPADTLPLLCDSPHSGTWYPPDFGYTISARPSCAAANTHIDALWSHAPKVGATLICARFPRTYIDPNRPQNDIDVSMLDAPWPHPVVPSEQTSRGYGLVWKQVRDGALIYAQLSVAELRIEIMNAVDPGWAPGGPYIPPTIVPLLPMAFAVVFPPEYGVIAYRVVDLSPLAATGGGLRPFRLD